MGSLFSSYGKEDELSSLRGRKLISFLLGTWTGRIIVVNFIVFAIVSFMSGSLFNPTTEALLFMGAKDSVLLAQGEFWRLLTPIFVHIGLVHFLFNTWALYALGYELERILNRNCFLIIYLVSGIAGNICSALFSLSVSAGASSSLFGLLGCGFIIERRIGRIVEERTGLKQKVGAYSTMVVANLILGFIVPQIDNAAHLGGLIGGVISIFIILNIVPNSLWKPRRSFGVVASLVFSLILSVGAVLSCSRDFTMDRYLKASEGASIGIAKYRYISSAISLSPEDTTLRFERLRLLLFMGYYKDALRDLEFVLISKDVSLPMFEDLLNELITHGKLESAYWLKRFLK